MAGLEGLSCWRLAQSDLSVCQVNTDRGCSLVTTLEALCQMRRTWGIHQNLALKAKASLRFDAHLELWFFLWFEDRTLQYSCQGWQCKCKVDSATQHRLLLQMCAVRTGHQLLVHCLEPSATAVFCGLAYIRAKLCERVRTRVYFKHR